MFIFVTPDTFTICIIMTERVKMLGQVASVNLPLVFVLLVTSNGLRVNEAPEQNCSVFLNNTRYSSRHENEQQCPPWFIFNDHTRTCRSGPRLGGIIQQDLSTLLTKVLECYCMTEGDGEVSVGNCIYTCTAVEG